MAENSQAVIPDNLIIVDGEIGGGLPSSSASDAGKVLTVDGEGSPEWVTPSGGTQYTEGNGIDISEQNVVSIDTSVVATKTDLSSYQPTISDLSTIRSGAEAGATAVQPSSLATVATSGSYTDLSNKPTIPTVDQVYNAASANAQSGVAVASAVSGKQDTISDLETIRSGAAAGATAVQPSQLATVATTGSYADLSNKPSIPAAQVNADWDAVSGVSQILNKPTLATVATSGSYADLSNKPSIPDAQVNSDWDAVSGVAQILNKPTLATVATSGSYDDLTNKPSIPAAQIQSDWDQSDNTAADYIKNKPSIPAAQVNADWDAVSGAAQILNKPTIPTVAQSYNALSTDAMSGTAVAEAISGTGQVPSVTSTDNGKVLKATYSGGVGSFGWDAAPSGVPSTTSSDEGKVLGVTDNQGSLGWVSQTPAQVNSDWDAVSGAAQILNKPTLATVATSGSYEDLTNKPSIPAAQVNADWDAVSGVSQILNKPTLATVATSGSYADLSNKPSIPAAQIQSDWDQSDNTAADYIKNKPSIPAAQVNADWDAVSGVSQILNKPSLATVATSGSYADLSNKPSIPTVDQVYSASSANAQSGVAVASAVSGKQDTISDLETIRSGAALGATAVQPSALATVATSGSYNDLSNKPSIPAAQVNADWDAVSGISQILNKPSLATVATSGSYNDLSNKPSIPAAQIQSDWDQTDNTAVDFIKNKPTIPAAQVNSDWNAVSGVSQILNKPTIPTVDQSYSALSTNAQSGVAVANAISAVNQVPSSTSADENKVLTVNSSGNAEWAAAQGGSDIFIADTTSTNEDVFQAYLAGKVLFYKDASNGIYNLTRTSESTSAGYLNTVFSGYRASNVNVAEFANVTVFSVTIQSQNGHANSSLFSASITNKNVRVLNMPLLSGNAGKFLTVNSGATAAEWANAPTELPTVTGNSGKILAVNSGATGVEWVTKPTTPTVDQTYNSASTNAQSGTAVAGALATVNQVPASTSVDEDKVLTVNSSGTPVWAAAQGGTTYTAGNMISLSNDAVAVSTTAGITDIQVVNALPASPVATVLYLIPET